MSARDDKGDAVTAGDGDDDDRPLVLPTLADCAVIHVEALPAPLIRRLINSLTLDAQRLARAPSMLRGCLLSLSLSLAEKDRVIREFPRLSDFQISELDRTFIEEVAAFSTVARTEFRVTANLQARALWNAMAVLGNRCGTSPRLERAWLMRTLRRCPPQGEFRQRLAAMDDAWWGKSVYARWAYRGLFAPDHAAWVD